MKKTVTNPGQTSMFAESILDSFAGGGGASVGIEMATGRVVDYAINHNPDAIKMHEIQPVKIRGQHAHRIDGGVTLIMIEEVYRRNRSDYINVVEAQNGIS